MFFSPIRAQLFVGWIYLFTSQIAIQLVFVRVLENLESPGILQWHFPGLESPGKRLLVLESTGNLSDSSEKCETYGRQ